MNTPPVCNSVANPLPWYGLRIRSKGEQVASTVLKGKGFEPFVPTYKVRRQWTDRIRETELPLFPGYVFCRMDPAHRLAVLTSTGVVGIVGVGKVPVPIEEREIDAIRAVIHSGLPCQPWPFMHQGDTVQVKHGPLRGVRGILESVKGRQSLLVGLTLLQRSISVELDPAWVAVQ